MAQEPIQFRLSPRWKEELVVSCGKGSFVLPFWMGRPTVELPSRKRWVEIAPEWARDHWDHLHRDLQSWCQGNGAVLEISDNSEIFGV